MRPATEVDAVDVWWASLTKASTALRPLLSPHEWERSMRRSHPADQGRRLVAAALLRVAVAARTGADPSHLQVERSCAQCGGDHGCPRTQGACVSVSHAGQVVAVAVAGVPLGVDVESESSWHQTCDELAVMDDGGAKLSDPGLGDEALGGSPLGWTQHEALIKLHGCAVYVQGPAETRPRLTTLQPPTAGYVASLATFGVPHEVRVGDGDALLDRGLRSLNGASSRHRP